MNQELIIAHSNTKRRIKGAFNLCASIEKYKRLLVELNQQIKEWEEKGSVYGWMYFNLYTHETLPNTMIEDWD